MSEPPETAGKVSFVCSPIGNLADITLRALDALRAADIIACEDTRHSRRLLDRQQISSARLVSYHEHNEAARSAQLADDVRAGLHVAVLTDAGAPTVSDPGLRLVDTCIRQHLPYEILPGASALTTGLAGSGLATGAFYFAGFLPNKSGGRERDLRLALERDVPTVFFESPHRIVRTLTCLATLAPDRLVCVARELTKLHEEFRRSTAADLLAHYTARHPKGEITLVVSGTKLPRWLGETLPSPAVPPA
ncbi:16S rRNA (cytidine(1402)-2'-O)-methyltransferase [soil metagenome]